MIESTVPALCVQQVDLNSSASLTASKDWVGKDGHSFGPINGQIPVVLSFPQVWFIIFSRGGQQQVCSMHCSSDKKKTIWHKELVTSLVARQFVKPFSKLFTATSLRNKHFSQRDLRFGSSAQAFGLSVQQPPCVTRPNGHSHMFLLRLKPQAHDSCHLWCIMPCTLVSVSPLWALLRVFFCLLLSSSFFVFFSVQSAVGESTKTICSPQAVKFEPVTGPHLFRSFVSTLPQHALLLGVSYFKHSFVLFLQSFSLMAHFPG